MPIYRTIPLLTKQDVQRFWIKVDKSPGHGPKGDCWEWQNCRDDDGYGCFGVQGRVYRATRIVYSLEHASDDITHLMVCHSCDNPPCCNPDHLSLGTSSSNLEDAARKGRMARGNKHGKRCNNSAPRWSAVTPEIVIELHRLHNTQGLSAAALGRKFNLYERHVHNILNGDCWRDFMP
jgi:hypothetical protein